MRALLVYPSFPKTYWGQEYTFPVTGKRAIVPPLGLLTVAAALPRDVDVRLVDMNVERLTDDALRWTDVVMIGSMRIQRASFHEVVQRAHALGRRVVAGGPFPTTDPEAAADADHLVLGEADELVGELCAGLAAGRAPRLLQAPARPDVTRLPVPRYDLLRLDAYNCVGVQFSRGCPFSCEFCDIIEIFGRVPRTKTPAQVLGELDAVRRLGFHGPVFLVDDNFIGNKREARRLLVALADWQRRHRFPFDFFTEASMNLATDDELVDGLVDAGFSSVFVGIETPSVEALLETKKRQNTHLDLAAGVEKLVRRGLTVMAGFIVGFDSDDEDSFERQREFIAASPISLAMVGMLTALPGTQLWRRLAGEGRLLGEAEGDNVFRPNFATRLPASALVAGYRQLLADLYEPKAYFARARREIALLPAARTSEYRRPAGWALATLLRSLWLQGVRGRYRGEYWRFLADVARTAPRSFGRAMSLAIAGEHMIRYTREDVLPRLGAELEELAAEPVAASRAGAPAAWSRGRLRVVSPSAAPAA